MELSDISISDEKMNIKAAIIGNDEYQRILWGYERKMAEKYRKNSRQMISFQRELEEN